MWKIQGCFHFLQLFVFWIFLSHVNFRFEISMWVSHGSVWEWYYSPSGPVSQGFPVSSTRFQIPNEFMFFTSSFRLPIDHISIYILHIIHIPIHHSDCPNFDSASFTSTWSRAGLGEQHWNREVRSAGHLDHQATWTKVTQRLGDGTNGAFEFLQNVFFLILMGYTFDLPPAQ